MSHRIRSLWKVMALCVVLALLVAACGAPAPGGGSASAPAATGGDAAASTGDSGAEINVWVDATRLPAIDRFKELHPEVAHLIRTSTVDRGEFPAKVLLFNNSGSGWPDVVFAEPSIVARVADEQHAFPADLNEWVSPDILEGFAEGSLAPCTFEGKLYCLRNDLAQAILYYNVPLMEEFGYEVPDTWEEYEELGMTLAQEHPDYLIGTFGDLQGLRMYFWPSECPVNEEISSNQIRINLEHPNCIRMAQMLDRLIEAGVIAKLPPFDPAFVDLVKQDKLLMMPAASWFGEYVFGGKPDSTYYQTAEGQLGVAPIPKWSDQEVRWTGAQGGSAWTMSRHTENPELAVQLIVWLTTSEEYQGQMAPTFPAYLPAAQIWAETTSGNPLYAFDPYPVMEEAAGLIDPKWREGKFDYGEPFGTTVVETLISGGTIEEALPRYQEALVSLAQAEGYEVITEGP